jgi:two-component sensor histidine kinase
VRTLAAVHDLLTEEAKDAPEASTISARAILEKLLSLLKETTGGRKSLTHELDDARLSARQGTALALVTSELVGNAIKHGAATAAVRFVRRDTAAELVVSDDGPGFPTGFDPAAAAHTGLDLVENLSRWDLQGQSRYETAGSGGGQVTIAFPLAPEVQVSRPD